MSKIDEMRICVCVKNVFPNKKDIFIKNTY